MCVKEWTIHNILFIINTYNTDTQMRVKELSLKVKRMGQHKERKREASGMGDCYSPKLVWNAAYFTLGASRH